MRGRLLLRVNNALWATALSGSVLLGQQAHEVGGCVGVQSQGRHRDVSGCVGPVLVVVVQASERGMRRGGLGQHNLPCKKKGQTVTRKPAT